MNSLTSCTKLRTCAYRQTKLEAVKTKMVPYMYSIIEPYVVTPKFASVENMQATFFG